jgi:hypothetical protein
MKVVMIIIWTHEPHQRCTTWFSFLSKQLGEGGGGGGKKGFGVLVVQQSIEAQNAHETHKKCAAGFFLFFQMNVWGCW